MRVLREWLGRAFLKASAGASLPPIEVRGLLGLGPGLTPSGDDFLGGALIALRTINKVESAIKLWEGIAVSVPTSTNEISSAQLFAASHGYGADSVHRLLNSIFTHKIGEFLQDRKLVENIGHTSGCDIMLGCKMVIETWIKSENN